MTYLLMVYNNKNYFKINPNLIEIDKQQLMQILLSL